MDKSYKVSYKTYLNDRLKEVYLHGTMTYPLYVQVTFDRKSIFFKSYYFDLFSKPKYFLHVPGTDINTGPSMQQIIGKEEELLDYIIDKHAADFSLELFKKEYAYYCNDLLDVMEPGFIEYLYVFFQDEGMPDLAAAIREGLKYRGAENVVRDMKRAFQKPIYQRLVENSLWYAPPYLPLNAFTQQIKKWPMLSLSVMEWEKPETITDFDKYLTKYYPQREAKELVEEVNKIIKDLRKEADTRVADKNG
ncbi:MAG: hypothetical protein JSU01_09665 [Bacteroidetes bacterium]|nr:hypothetical protein [Bacteroidota bacterium]